MFDHDHSIILNNCYVYSKQHVDESRIRRKMHSTLTHQKK